MADFRNKDGTYNGAAMLAAASGLSKEEILWTFDRMKHLLNVEGMSKDEAKLIVSEECKEQPWRT